MKTIALISALMLFSCQQPATSNATPPDEPMMSKICITVNPADAFVKVQGARVKHNGCIDTFPGEVAFSATAPGYKPYQELIPVEGHAFAHHIQMAKEDPASTPAASAPTSSASTPTTSQKAKP